MPSHPQRSQKAHSSSSPSLSSTAPMSFALPPPILPRTPPPPPEHVAQPTALTAHPPTATGATVSPTAAAAAAAMAAEAPSTAPAASSPYVFPLRHPPRQPPPSEPTTGTPFFNGERASLSSLPTASCSGLSRRAGADNDVEVNHDEEHDSGKCEEEEEDGTAMACVVPQHWSVFYPLGMAAQPPVLLHYLSLGSWRTIAGGWDYFAHRRLQKREIVGHTVRWLHNAHPRDRFVFIVDPVEAKAEDAAGVVGSGGGGGGGGPRRKAAQARRWWQRQREKLFGVAPGFAYNRGKLVKQPSQTVQAAEAAAVNAASDADSGLVEGASGGVDGAIHMLTSPAGGRRGGYSVTTGLPTPSPRLSPIRMLNTPVGQVARTFPTRLSTSMEAARARRPFTSPPQYSPLQLHPSQSHSRAEAGSVVYSALPCSPVGGRSLSAPRRRANGEAELADGHVRRHRHSSVGEHRGRHGLPRCGSVVLESSSGGLPLGKGGAKASCPAPPSRRIGVEAIEICHADITAMDYAPRLTSSRFSIEAKAVYTYFFPSLHDAFVYYGCPEASAQVQQQYRDGLSHQIPQPPPATVAGASTGERGGAARGATVLDAAVPPGRPNVSSTLGASRTSLPAVGETGVGGEPVNSEGHRRDLLCPGGHSGQPPLIPSLYYALPSPPPSRLPSLYEVPDLAEAMRGVQSRYFSEGGEAASQGATAAAAHRGVAQPNPRSSTLHTAGSHDTNRDGGVDRHRVRPAVSSATATWPMAGAVSPTSLLNTPQRVPRRDEVESSGQTVEKQPPHGEARHTSPPHPRHSLSLPDFEPMTTNSSGKEDTAEQTSSRSSSSLFAFSSPMPLPPPPAVRPVLTSAHSDTIVSVYTADPHFNAVLREVLMPEPRTHPYTADLKEQRRMLAMYETGMPSWTVFLASTWLPYRRWYRLLYVAMVNIWPLISLTVGLYDLYKHLPQLKQFVEHTLEPVTRWIEQRVTLRVSMLCTYLLSAVLTIFASASSFFSQFYFAEFFALPVVRLVVAGFQMPFRIAFDTVWAVSSIGFSFVRLVFMTVKVVIIGPFMLVAQMATLQVGSAVPVAMEGTSLTLRWWRAWQEFWTTVVSPIKNLAKAWLDSVSHVMVSATRREASIRRWYSPKVAFVVGLLGDITDIGVENVLIAVNIFGPGYGKNVVLFASTVYLYWLLLIVPPSLLAEVCTATTGAGKEVVRWQWSLLVHKAGPHSHTDVDAANSHQRKVVEGYLGSARDAWEQLLSPVYHAVYAPVVFWRELNMAAAASLQRLSSRTYQLTRAPGVWRVLLATHARALTSGKEVAASTANALMGRGSAATNSSGNATNANVTEGEKKKTEEEEEETAAPVQYPYVYTSMDVVDYGLLGRPSAEQQLYDIGHRVPGTTELIGLRFGFDPQTTYLYDSELLEEDPAGVCEERFRPFAPNKWMRWLAEAVGFA